MDEPTDRNVVAQSQAEQQAADTTATPAPDVEQQEQLQESAPMMGYQLDVRGKIENFDESDWFVAQELPFKRRQNVASTMVTNKPHPWKRIKQMIAVENYSELPADTPTYVNLEPPPSMYPPKRYCDITGTEAAYVDPMTKLRYASTDAFRIARSLTADEIQARLAIRNAQTFLK
jgi:INO80 complex subunit C